uniref:Uncharacterized protein n=1 Tax=Micrurus lemniscatus lemniscatus TaxID=129467 RepID=A0A2D4IE44_MICLE
MTTGWSCVWTPLLSRKLIPGFIEIVLPDFCPNPTHHLEHKWHKLDIKRALRIYIKRTSTFRKTEAYLSLSPIIQWVARPPLPPKAGRLDPVLPKPTSLCPFRCQLDSWWRDQESCYFSRLGYSSFTGGNM